MDAIHSPSLFYYIPCLNIPQLMHLVGLFSVGAIIHNAATNILVCTCWHTDICTSFSRYRISGLEGKWVVSRADNTQLFSTAVPIYNSVYQALILFCILITT